jgi:PAS domain-containing protein
MRRDGHIQDFESRIYRHDGSVIWISENSRAVHDELAGELLYYEGMVQDITRRKSAEEARKQPKKALFATQRSCALRMRSSKQTSEWRVTFNRCFSPKRIRAFRLA